MVLFSKFKVQSPKRVRQKKYDELGMNWEGMTSECRVEIGRKMGGNEEERDVEERRRNKDKEK